MSMVWSYRQTPSDLEQSSNFSSSTHQKEVVVDTMADIVADLNGVISKKQPKLSEIIKDFHKYVNSKENEIAANITVVLDSFPSSTNFEKYLRGKLINKYQVRDEVVKLIKSGNSLNINQAMKCSWFFADIPHAESFVDDFIPCLSLSTRLKVLNMYSTHLNNAKAAEIIYEGVKSRYGMKTAILILPACGENFIRNELPNVKFTLSPGIVLLLFKKYPSLTIEYIKYLAEDNRKRKYLQHYESVFVNLASKDVDVFLKFTEAHQDHLPRILLGRRTTKKLMKTHNVVDKYDKYERFLKKKIFFPRLSADQIKKLYVANILPSDVGRFIRGAYTAQMTLQYFKPQIRSDVILSSFKFKYGREMTDDSVMKNLDDSWVCYLPVERRIKFLDVKILEHVSDPVTQAKYIAQLPVEQAIPKLRQLIESLSDADGRAIIAKIMVETLNTNKCSTAIKDLFAYFVKRFRNETSNFRSGIVREMFNFGKMFLELEVDDWTPIMDFINIMKLNREIYNDYGVENALIAVFDYRVQNSFKHGNVNDCLKDYLDLAKGDDKSCNYKYLGLCDNTQYRSFCLQWLLNVVPQMKWARDEFTQNYRARLYKELATYNVKNPESPVACPEWLNDSVNTMVENEQWDNLLTIEESAKKVDKLLWQSILKKRLLKGAFSDETVSNMLRFEPFFIKDSIDSIVEKHLPDQEIAFSLFKKFRLFDPFGIPSEMSKICRLRLEINDDSTWVPKNSLPNAIGSLAMLEPSQEFLKIALMCAPVASRIEDYSEENQALFDIQKAICRSFIYLTSPQDALPVIQKFAVGDYLKLVAETLVNVCARVPESNILPILRESMNCPVSLRKHYLKLLYRIAPTKERVQVFVNIFKNEKNISLRLVLFQMLRRAFIDEPDDDTYRTFESVLTQLTEEDKEALQELFDVEKFEDDFVARYLERIWELSGSKWASVVPQGKSKIVGLVSCRLIKFLSEDFCGELLSYELSDKLPAASCSKYLSVYLLLAPSNEIQAVRLSKVMASLEPLIKSSWNEYKLTSEHVFPVRYVVFEFVSDLCCEAPEHMNCTSVHPIHLLDSVKQTLSALIHPVHFLRESLRLDVTIKTLQNKQSNLPTSSLVSSLVDLYKSYLQTHSQCEYGLIQCLVNCTPPEIKSELSVALCSDANSTCQIIGLELLSTYLCKQEEMTTYKSIIENSSASNDPSVQAVAGKFFAELTSTLIP